MDDLTIQVVENTIINRARLKKEGKEFGTALDVASKASDILAGPQSGHFGEFTTKRIEQGEDGNLVVAKAVFGTTMYKQVDGIIEWDDNGHKVEIPFVTKEQIKNLEDEVVHLQDLVIGFDTEEIKTKVNELEQFPVPDISTEIQNSIESLVMIIMQKAKNSDDYSKENTKVDELVMTAFGLDEEEKETVRKFEF